MPYGNQRDLAVLTSSSKYRRSDFIKRIAWLSESCYRAAMARTARGDCNNMCLLFLFSYSFPFNRVSTIVTVNSLPLSSQMTMPFPFNRQPIGPFSVNAGNFCQAKFRVLSTK